MKRLILITLSLFAFGVDSFACTSAIVSAQRSSEGVPLLWKHRDNTKVTNTRIDYITGGKYAYTAVVPNNRNYKRGLFAGINEVGLGVITTSTKNLPVATPEEWEASPRKRVKGSLSWRALRECATVDEFEDMLRSEKRARGFDSNLGIADATGAVAYFEIWDLGYRRYDVSAEKGFDVRSNFSFVSDPKKWGSSKRRYDLIMQEMGKQTTPFTPQQFIDFSRSYSSVKYGDILTCDKVNICSNHTVPRATTIGSFVLVCDGKNPRLLVINGHSVPGLAVPVYVKAKREIPQCVKGNSMRLLAEDFQAKAYRPVGDKINLINKEIIGKVLKVRQPKIEMPKEMPSDIRAFNAAIDKKFAAYEKRVRKVLDKATIPHPLHD